MLGHASAALTLDTYTDLFEDDLDAVADRLDAVRSSSLRTSADSLRTEPRSSQTEDRPYGLPAQGIPEFQRVETRGIEPLTPALQSR
jgi:hypothetical protein